MFRPKTNGGRLTLPPSSCETGTLEHPADTIISHEAGTDALSLTTPPLQSRQRHDAHAKLSATLPLVFGGLLHRVNHEHVKGTSPRLQLETKLLFQCR